MNLVKPDLCGAGQVLSFREVAEHVDYPTPDNIECYGTKHGSASIDQTSE